MKQFLRRGTAALVCCAACGFDSTGSGSGSASGSESSSTSGSDVDSITSAPVTMTTETDTTPSDDTTTDDPSTTAPIDDTTGVDTGRTSNEDDTTTTGEPVLCARTHELVIHAEDADLTGDWTLESSEMGEGMYLYPNGNENAGYMGTATFTIDVPCADDWYVWTRYFDWGSQDSWYIRVDGEPGSKQAIFEGGCTATGNHWAWAAMNYRELDADGCDYLHDPWVQAWDAGEHTVEFEIRETSSISRIVVVNDPGFTPG